MYEPQEKSARAIAVWIEVNKADLMCVHLYFFLRKGFN